MIRALRILLILIAFVMAGFPALEAYDAGEKLNEYRQFLLDLPDSEYELMMLTPDNVEGSGKIRIASPNVTISIETPKPATIAIHSGGATMIAGERAVAIASLATAVPNFLYDPAAFDADIAKTELVDIETESQKTGNTDFQRHVKIIRYHARADDGTRYDYDIMIDDSPLGRRRLMGWKTVEWPAGSNEPAITEYRLFDANSQRSKKSS